MITFIVPTINRPTLHRAIDSLIAQTDGDWKCIVIFDGVEEVDFDDKRILSIEIPKLGKFGNNGNAGLVRNVGIEMVETEWIGFLDDDDQLDKDYVKTLKKYADFDLVIFKMLMPNGKVIPSGDQIKINDVGISFAYRSKFKQKFINSDAEDFYFVNELKDKANFVITKEIGYKVR